MEWAGKELKIKEMSDWYNVKTEVVLNTWVCGSHNLRILQI